jgi:hypothetical protein
MSGYNPILSGYNAILLRAQKALYQYISAQTFTWTYSGTSVTVGKYRGIDNADLTLPAIICNATSAEHEDVPFWTGNWRVTAEIIVREAADDCTEDEHLTHAGEVFDCFVASDLVSGINTACTTTIEVVRAGPPATTSYSIANRHWESSMTFTMLVNNT